MSAPTPHPAAVLFPLMDGIELAAFVDDIREHGLLEPIVLYEGKVLDGRNRLAACELAGVEPRFIEWQEDDQTPTEFVISMNLKRRHLTVGQCVTVGLDALPRLREEAKLRQGTRTDLTSSREREEVQYGGSSRKVAELVGVGHTAIETGIAIQKRDPEGIVIDRMRAGELNVQQAQREVGLGRSTLDTDGRRNKAGQVAPVYYGKGDKFNESITPAVRYFRAWRARDFRFTHVGYKEARKRLKVLDQLAADIEGARADLAAHSEPIKQTV